MDHQHMRKIIRREIEGSWTEQNPHTYRETAHPHRVSHGPTFGDTVGHEGHAEAATVFHNAFSDTHARIDHLVVEDDHAAYRVVYGGKHTGEFLGIAPTGKEVSVQVFYISRFEGEHIAESWAFWDGMGLLQQLGVLPPLGTGRITAPKKAAG